MIRRLTHVGLCVGDLERALRFYCEGLGFREVSALEVAGEPAATLLELPGVALRARYLERDGAVVELLYYQTPGATGDGGVRPMNALGLTHLSFQVDDLDTSAARLVSLGARLLAHTRVQTTRPRSRAVFLTDPDGTRIELVETPAAGAA